MENKNAPNQRTKGNEKEKACLPRLMMKKEHRKKRGKCTAKQCGKEKKPLGNSPQAMRSFIFIESVENKSEEIDSYQIGEKKA